MSKIMPDSKFLRECFEYDEFTGSLKWKSRPEPHFKRKQDWVTWNAKYPGTLTKGIWTDARGKQYGRVGISGTNYLVHRVIYKLMTGVDPDFIDHIDGDGLNNKWVNLREVNQAENMKNITMSSTNKSGCPGVHWNKEGKHWRACISIRGKSKHLGSFSSLTAAEEAYLIAKSKYGFHPLHGTDKRTK